MLKNVKKKSVIYLLIIGSILSIVVAPIGNSGDVTNEYVSESVPLIEEQNQKESETVKAMISYEEMLKIVKKLRFQNYLDYLKKNIDDIDFEKIVKTVKENNKTENNKKEVISNIKKENKLNFMDDIISVEKFLTKPTKEIFGDSYSDAVKFYNAILNKDESISISFYTGNSKNDSKMMDEFMDNFRKYVLNDLFEIEGIFATGGMTYYTGNPSLIYDEILLYDKLKREIINLGINEHTNPKDAVILINNWLCDYLSYELSANNPYIAYTNKKANCDGYATLFDRMCQIIGVECTWENGYVKTLGTYGNHAWNKVKIDDVWYYVDVCWNDSNRSGNRYLLSPSLWYDHTREVKLNVPVWNFNSNTKIKYRDINIENIYDIPTRDTFGEHYEAAMSIYNALVNKEDIVNINILTNGEKDSQKVYYEFETLFINEVLNSSCELYFNTISWRKAPNVISAEIDIKRINKKLQQFEDNKHKFRAINLSLGIDKNTSDLDAIAKITNYLNTRFDYVYHSEGLSIDMENKILGELSYCELFYGLCNDLGIDCKIIDGLKVKNDKKISGHWNQVKIGGVWYYSDIGYYKGISYLNSEEGEYFLSKELWDTHSIKNK